MFIRNLTPRLLRAIEDSPVVFLNGARQVGKSTLAQSIVRDKGGRYLTLDELDVLSAANSDPKGFLSGLKGLTVIDEVQKAPALFPAIKVLVDKDRRPARFLLTGSANVLTVPKISESLAGRMQLVNLHTLSQGEIGGMTEGFVKAAFADEIPDGTDTHGETTNLTRRVLKGGYPELLGPGRTPSRSEWFSSYITTILQRDVRDISDIAGLSEMPRLLALLAARSTALFNRSDIARDLGWPRSTVDRYLGLLEMIFLFDLLPAWSGNLGKKLTRSPKVIFRDTGLASHLVGSDPNHPPPDHLFGRLLENFIVMELQRQVTWSEGDIQLFHFRTHGGSEIDILLEDRRGRVVAIEVKSTSSPTATMFRHMKRLAEDLGDRFHRGILLSRSENRLAFGSKIVTLPLDSLWTLGSQPQGESM